MSVSRRAPPRTPLDGWLETCVLIVACRGQPSLKEKVEPGAAHSELAPSSLPTPPKGNRLGYVANIMSASPVKLTLIPSHTEKPPDFYKNGLKKL